MRRTTVVAILLLVFVGLPLSWLIFNLILRHVVGLGG
jgi:hypothetical protein